MSSEVGQRKRKLGHTQDREKEGCSFLPDKAMISQKVGPIYHAATLPQSLGYRR